MHVMQCRTKGICNSSHDRIFSWKGSVLVLAGNSTTVVFQSNIYFFPQQEIIDTLVIYCNLAVSIFYFRYFCQVEDYVWYCTCPLHSIGTRNGIFSGKSSVALSGFLCDCLVMCSVCIITFTVLFNDSMIWFIDNYAELGIFILQQGKISEAEKSVTRLFGKERVAEVMNDLDAASQGSTEPEAGWFDLFSSRYLKGIPQNRGFVYLNSRP